MESSQPCYWNWVKVSWSSSDCSSWRVDNIPIKHKPPAPMAIPAMVAALRPPPPPPPSIMGSPATTPPGGTGLGPSGRLTSLPVSLDGAGEGGGGTIGDDAGLVVEVGISVLSVGGNGSKVLLVPDGATVGGDIGDTPVAGVGCGDGGDVIGGLVDLSSSGDVCWNGLEVVKKTGSTLHPVSNTKIQQSK
jgi:hypothetical protein